MANVIFFSYDGILDPLGQSQILPYLQNLSKSGHNISIISYEKTEREFVKFETVKKIIREHDINWYYLDFKKGKFQVIIRLIKGILLLNRICRKSQPDFVHLRGFLPAIMFQLSGNHIRSIYDFRGFALHEWVDIGKISKNSLIFRFLNWIDKKAVANASGLVVLENFAKDLLYETYDVPTVPLKVIRTCTDTKRYHKKVFKNNFNNNPVRLACLGGARFPYRPDFTLKLAENLNKANIDCTIDFINQGDHEILQKNIRNSSLSKDKIGVINCDHSQIPRMLSNYDCGIIMIETSRWRKVCSPTKFGEYLASGLPVISLQGIDVIDMMSQQTACVVTISNSELMNSLNEDTILKIKSLFNTVHMSELCRVLAKKEFDLSIAEKLYSELYEEIEGGNIS